MFKDLWNRGKLLYQNERVAFYLAASKTAFMLLYFILMMFPFFVKSGYGDITRYSILKMPFAFLLIPLWLISILAFVYLVLMKKEQESKKLQFGQLILCAVIFITLFIDFIVVAANTVSFIKVYLSIGFFFSLIASAGIALITLKDSLLLEQIMRFFKPINVVQPQEPQAVIETPPTNE